MDPTNATSQPIPFKPSEVFNIIPFSRRQGRNNRPVKEILQKIQHASEESLQPGAKQDPAPVQNLHNLLRKITIKSLKFGEDVRPPYQGTWTRNVPESSIKKLCRNPYHRCLPDMNYDYDSEAEWEEPEEGEDLNSEDEDEMSDDGEDDMDEFLDDEDDALAGGKRRLIVGDLEPVNSGIRWAADGIDPNLKIYQIETISDAVKFPIDPFSSAYWEKPRVEPAVVKARVAVNGLEAFGVKAKLSAPAVSAALPPPPSTSKAKKPFPPESLDEFKQAVDGSDLSKIGLVEILKKKYVESFTAIFFFTMS
jgi:chromatin assembly factor 1 subunit A